ncbi:MAG: metallophosphoesterase [Deltaproteobacteria bacterium]|nr:metallophosphoesterase [Deltaproteobacteria bacterium]
MRLGVAGLLTLLGSQAFAQGAVFRGPYLQDVSSDGISIVWESPNPSTGVVRFGVANPTARTISGGGPARHQSVRLSGLTQLAPPGSKFTYELEVDGVTRAGTFRTAPAPGTPFTFLVYGDNRSSRPQHEAVVQALVAEMDSVAFAMNTGDLVSDGQSESDWDAFFEVEAPFLAHTPFFVAIGNHEVELTSWSVTERIVEHPSTALAPASSSESFYHFQYGNVELIVVNVEVDNLYTISLLAGAQEEWLERVIGTRPPGIDHRFLFIHQGAYSSKPGRNGNFWLRQWLDSLKPEIDVIFSGHDHYAELGFSRTGIPYVVHGGGGAPLYDTLGPRVTNDHTIVYGESRLGYVLVDVDGPEVQITIKGIDGSTVSTFEYGSASAPECLSPSDCGPPLLTSCPDGAWECHRGACRYECSDSGSLFGCLSDNACAQSIGSYCSGEATCEKPGIDPRQWYCLCNVPPDCSTDGDCAGRPPPVAGCVGTWGCVGQACEFSPTTICEEPTTSMDASVDASVDGAVSDAASGVDAVAIPDATTGPDVSLLGDDARASEDAASQVSDASASNPDAGQDEGTGEPEATSGCGCASTGRGALGVWALMALMAMASRRLRGPAQLPVARIASVPHDTAR